MKSNRVFLWVCLAVVAGCIGMILVVSNDWIAGSDEPSLIQRQERQIQRDKEAARKALVADNRESLADALNMSQDEIGKVGGIDRPLRDITPNRAPEQSDSDEPRSIADIVSSTPRPGVAPRLQGNENPQVAGLMAEIQGEDQESTDDQEQVESAGRVVTTWEQAEPFDRREYEANPDSYLNKIRPARVFDPAQPGEGVTPLEQITPAFTHVLQGEQVVLRVKADPGMPVAFYTNSSGSFTENLLASVTVKANDDGVATATFKAGKGTNGLIDILAASPVHSRQLQFRVKVDLPDRVEDQ